MPNRRPPQSAVRPRLRILHGKDIAIGPGKAELLGHVQETGSISQAAKRMGMSYMRAWTLIKTMERCFKEPLVQAARGGSKGGGAQLTQTGRTVLDLYQRMEQTCLAGIDPEWAQMKRLLRG